MKKQPIKTINFSDELKSGNHFGVFIDDTGSPGLDTPGLNMNRKTWVALIIPPHQMSEVMEQLPGALSYLKEMGINDPEFHFKDILAGKGDYKKVDLQVRLAIFRFMAHIFAQYKFPALVQTFDPINSAEVLASSSFPKSFGPLQFSRHDDLALIFLLLRVRQYLQEQTAGSKSACVVVDEGRLKEGQSIVLPGLAPEFLHGAILFASSRKVKPVQLADFAAFALNKWQLLRVKPELNDIDKTLLEIFSPIGENFINAEKMKVHGLSNLINIKQGLN